MKIKFIVATFVAAMLLAGCSDKNPNANEQMVDKEFSSVEGSNGNVTVEQSIKNIEAKLETVYFRFDSFAIEGDMTSKVQDSAKLLIDESGKNFSIKVEGNCDEWGTDEYNYALGLKRAKTVKNALIELGVDKNRLVTVSYGEGNPACQSSTEDCWNKNRRVDYKLLP